MRLERISYSKLPLCGFETTHTQITWATTGQQDRMAPMTLTIFQKTGALIWASKGGPTRRELPDGDSQQPVRTQEAKYYYGTT